MNILLHQKESLDDSVYYVRFYLRSVDIRFDDFIGYYVDTGKIMTYTIKKSYPTNICFDL